MSDILFPTGFTVDIPRLDMEKRKKFQIKTVRDLLHENIDKRVDMAMITNKINIRRSQLYNAFQKEYGITPKKYLQPYFSDRQQYYNLLKYKTFIFL